MQSQLIVLALSGLASAFTATQVKDDLDSHPWRPAPTAPLVQSGSQAVSVAKPLPVAAQAPSTAPATTGPGPTTTVAPGSWQLQIAALSSLDAARVEQKRIEKIVGPGKVEVLSEGQVHRVRYGAYTTKETAEIAREELRSKGIEGFPVKKQ